MHVLFLFIIPVITVSGELFPLTGTGTTLATTKIDLPSDLFFPFTGSLFDKLYISKDGFVSNDPIAAFKAKEYFTSLSKDDFAFIAPFYYNGETPGITPSGCTGPPGQILYRAGGQVTPTELMEYDNLIRKSFAGIDQYISSWALVVSWKNVYRSPENWRKTCQTVNFQLALLTDGVKSFAIFNYRNMGIDLDGISGRHFEQVGFNAEYGRGYSVGITFSVLEDKEYETLIAGQHLYRIDKLSIIRGSGCSKHADATVKVYPETVGMFGGQMLDVYGPCFSMNDPVIKCRFGKDEEYVTYGYKVNEYKVRCHVPTLVVRGRIAFELSIDFQPYLEATTIFVTLEYNMDDKLGLPYLGKQFGWNETDTKELTVTWDSDKLSRVPSAMVHLSLIGYREINNEIEWATLLNIGNTQAHANTFSFRTDRPLCSSTFCTDYEVGFVQVELVNATYANTHRFQIDGVVLGFYENFGLTAQLGKDWPRQKCKSWYDSEKQRTDWLKNLPACPCNLQQALSDIGRWYSDHNCDMYNNKQCHYHRGAVHCVRAVYPSEDGAGSHCCYDKSGDLMFAADNHQGSSVDRGNEAGVPPFGKPNMVPSLSHLIHDVSPFHHCCLWSNFKDCDMYMEVRPTIDCTTYQPPTPGLIFGQGHIRTFDDATHRMCAEGDFILMIVEAANTDPITVQGRFSRNIVPISGSMDDSVILTNLAVLIGPDIVEVRLKPPVLGSLFSQLEIMIEDTNYFFNDIKTAWQDFDKFTIINTDTVRPAQPGNFTIILKNGLGIQVAVTNNVMSALFMMPYELKGGGVSGLLGNFNGNKDDDLGGMPVGADTKQLYEIFQYKWAVQNPTASIMSLFVPPNVSSSSCSEKAISGALFCEGIVECNFDFYATRNEASAKKTLTMTQRLQELRDFTTKVRSCGLLAIPNSIKSNHNYNLGSSVTIQGCTNGETPKTKMFTCTATGGTTQSWNPQVYDVCAVTSSGVNTDVIIGAVIGVVAVIVLIIIAVILIRKCRTVQKEREQYTLTRKTDDENHVNEEQ